jgi:hypothetical protein
VLFGLGEYSGYGGWSLFGHDARFIFVFMGFILCMIELLSWSTLLLLEHPDRP